MVPVPCNLEVLVHSTHDKTACMTLEYIHKTNVNKYFFDIKSVNCSLFHDIYPFVFEESSPERGYAQEVLKVGDKEIRRFDVPVGCGT